jgi:putative oligomerization/nucleic acid binding protein
MAQAQSQPVVKRAAGVLVLVVGAALIGYGVHYLAINGTCSSTGYSSIGPVPKCSGGEGLYITATFFLGPLVLLIGWGMARIDGLIWPVTCVCLGTGIITIELASGVSYGGKSFSLFAGLAFFALAIYSLIRTGRRRIWGSPAGKAAPGLFAPPASYATDSGFSASSPPAFPAPDSTPAPQFPVQDSYAPVQDSYPALDPVAGSSDPLDKIAKLAQLRDSGALTEAEFEQQKAKLLAQM